jgi:hypothetical protein
VAFAEDDPHPRRSGARRALVNSKNVNENKRGGDFSKRSAASLANPPFWYSFGTSNLFAFPSETASFDSSLVTVSLCLSLFLLWIMHW